jgi:2,4-dienoyl-CoA reductase-like NADH-dependent reductase (Old Yellow Enzyme family)
MKHLFDSFKIKDISFRNRIFVSPMCQYSCVNGVMNDWHLVHLGSRAVGGAGLVIFEATSPSPEGRITYADSGIWNDDQEKKLKQITTFIKIHGSVAGIQLAHAGRKASTEVPWRGGKPIDPADDRGWKVVGPSPLAFSELHQVPQKLSLEDMDKIKNDFVTAAQRCLRAGFEVLELHFAHGYLFHEFLSSLSNKRTDEYGGTLENRMRFPLEVTRAVRDVWPENLPFFVRISATDWVEGGWDLEQSIVLSEELRKCGVDLIDTSTGGNVPKVKIPTAPHYQVPFAKGIRQSVNILVGAVGMITEPEAANAIIQNGEADVVLLAREMLRDPYWPIHAAKALGVEPPVPAQYLRSI